jgi:hypothetical protein
MAKQVINNGESGLIVRGKINDNFTELYTGKDSVTVANFAALPAPASATGEKWWCLASQGVYLVNRKPAGSYYSDGAAWTWLGDNPTTADQVGNVPAGGISATDVQAALNGLDTGKLDIAGTAVSATQLATGRTIAITGDLTYTSPSFNGTGNVTAAGTIPANTVTLAKMAQVATARFLGRVTTATGDVEALTGTQATTLLDVFTSALKGLVPLSGGGTTNFLRADGTWAAPGGGGGGGDVVGPAGATDNGIVRYDGTTGLLIQDSEATIGDDGVIYTNTDSGANVCVIPLRNWIYQAADYTLTSSTAEQKIFNQTANGRLTLPTGIYEFNTFYFLTTMTATSGSASFDPVGAGTAVCDQFAYDSVGLDNSTQPNAVLAVSGVGSVTQQSGANVVLAGTGTGMRVRLQGRFRVSTAGTIIPSLSLVTAAAAVVKAGSYFRIEKVGETGDTHIGNWD